VTFDLGRRLGGRLAGSTAALVAATSGLLAVYGTVGRMYALLALVGAVSADLFLRALERRTVGAACLAAGAALLLPATHPFGAFVAAAEALVALVLWRGRPIRAGLPVAAIALGAIPFLVADARLSGRFGASEGGVPLLSSGDAWAQLELAVRGSGGGAGFALAACLFLGAVGAASVARANRGFFAFAVLAVVLPLGFSAVARVPDGLVAFLSPRHLIFALPVWAAFVGVGSARTVRPLRPRMAVAAVAALGVVLAASPYRSPDPRLTPFWAETGNLAALNEAAVWLRLQIEPGDVLYPYATPYLQAVDEARHATTLPRAQEGPLLAAIGKAKLPVRNVVVAVPVAGAKVDPKALARGLPAAYAVRRIGPWLFATAPGPFASRAGALEAIRGVLEAVDDVATARPPELEAFLDLGRESLCGALSDLGEPCAPRRSP
jgi:hypothetical protein